MRDSRSTAVLEAFSKQFPDTVYAVLARERLTQLRTEQQQLAMLQKEDERKRAEAAEATHRKAEEDAQRKQEQDKRRTEVAEARRNAEDDARRKQEEERRAAETRRKAEEDARIQVVLLAEAKRKAGEATAACLAEETKAESRVAPKSLEDSLQQEVRIQIQEYAEASRPFRRR